MFVDGTEVEKNFFQEGDLVFKEGDPGDGAFIVETGSIGIYKTVEGEEIQLATMSPGELFGEMAIVDGSRRMAHAVALEDSVVVSLPRAGLEALLVKQPPLLKTLIQILVENLRTVHEVYMKRPRSIQDYFSAIAFHMEGLRNNLEASDDADPSGGGLKRLKLIEEQMAVLSEQFEGPMDKKASVIEKPAAAPVKKPEGSTGDGG